MKITAIVLSLLVCAFAAQAQTVVLDYNMNQTPDLQGFSMLGSCSNVSCSVATSTPATAKSRRPTSAICSGTT